jgi:NitT/TauT family transport system permease protein
MSRSSAALSFLGGDHQPTSTTNASSTRTRGVRLTDAAKGIAGVVISLFLWEILRVSVPALRRFVPATHDVLAAALTSLSNPEVLSAIAGTLSTTVIGTFIAAAIAVPIGIAISLHHRLDGGSRYLVEAMRPISSVALIPVAVLMFGIGLRMKLSLVVFASIWPILFNTRLGVHATDSRWHDVGKLFGCNGFARLIRIILPASMPCIWSGIRLALSVSLIVSITVEMIIGSTGGIGLYLESARLHGRYLAVWSGVAITGLLGYLLHRAACLLERRVVGWSRYGN